MSGLSNLTSSFGLLAAANNIGGASSLLALAEDGGIKFSFSMTNIFQDDDDA